jgi:hypothetical protein
MALALSTAVWTLLNIGLLVAIVVFVIRKLSK